MRKLFRLIFPFFLLSLFSFKHPYLIPFLFLPIIFIRRKDFITLYLIFIFSGIVRISFYKTPHFLKIKEDKLKGVVISYEKNNSFLIKSDYGKILIYKNGVFSIKPGDVVYLEGYFLNQYKGNPGEESYYIYLLTEGIRGSFYANRVVKIKRSEDLISRLRYRIYENLNFTGKSFEIIEGFVLGGKSVESDIKELFKYSGAIHLFAISGIHIAILGGFFSLFLNPFFVFTILFVYLSLILFPISAIRAFFMFSFSQIGKSFKKEIDTINALIFSAIILILINPLIIISPSFLLTFISTFSILTISEKLKNFILRFLVTPTFITFGSFPILIYFFPFFSFITIISNLLLIPLISITLPIIFLFSMISLVIKEVILILKPISCIIEKLMIFFANLPLSSFGIKKPNFIFIIFYYSLYFLIAFALLENFKFKRSIKTLFILSFLTLLTFSISYLNEFGKLKIVFFDVGEGDSILLKTPKNYTILIDGGGTSYKEKRSPGIRVLNSLKRLGINKIDYLIFTHEDSDHIEGLFHIIKREKIKNLLYPDINLNSYGLELVKVLKQKNTKLNRLKRGDCFEIDGLKFFVLNPIQNGRDYLRANDNNNSLCFIIEYENYKFLLSGDIENEAIEEIYYLYPDKLKDIYVFKVPHHGSKNSFNSNFFYLITPEISIISVGPNNFNHPSNDILFALQSLNSKIYRTDIDGCVEIEIYSGKLKIKNYNFSDMTINLFD